MIAPGSVRARSVARGILAAGIVLRVVTWALMTPVNRDFHLGVILRMMETGRLALSNETDQSYHPPLYYLLTTPIFAVTHRPKVVQMFSLLCAIATLLIFYRLILETPLFGRMRDRLPLFALVAVHPQLITYGLYISNDTLTILLGTAAAWQLWRWIEAPDAARLRWLAVICGLGLLTKASFIPIAGVFTIAVAVLSWRADRSSAVRRVVEFAAIVAVLGIYKFAENVVHFGTPFVTNLDAGYAWIAEQASGRHMPWAYLGFSPHRLLLEPTGTDRRPYLEVLYQTAWYEYLPMSNLIAARRWPWLLTGSAALVAAIVPTLVMLAGIGVTLMSPVRWNRVHVARVTLVATWVALLLLLTAEEFHTHVWSIMHSRLLLPALPGALAALRVGWNAARRRLPAHADGAIRASIVLTASLLLLQHLTDLALVPFRIAH
jgi:hypothetical protein